MKTLLRAGAFALVLTASPAVAEVPLHATKSAAPAGFAPEMTTVVVPATSQPLTGTVTSAGVSPTSGGATFAAGTATIGAFAPQLGRGIALKLWTTNSATFSCQLFNSIDDGATKLPLTIFDTAIGGPYSTPVNSVITSETVSGTSEWLVCTVTSGTLNYAVVQ